MPLGAAQAQERNSCKTLLGPRLSCGAGAGAGPARAGGQAALRGRGSARLLTRQQASALRPSLRPGGSGPPQRRLPQPHQRPPPRARRRRRQAPGADETRPAPRRGPPPRSSVCRRAGAQGGEGARTPRADGEGSGIAHSGRSARRRCCCPPHCPPSSASPSLLPAGPLGAARRGHGAGARGRPPPAGRAGRAGAGARGGGQRRRGRDSRTLHLQVHLAHLGEPVAQIHGKLLDHCGQREGRGSGREGRESVSPAPPWGRGSAASSPRLPPGPPAPAVPGRPAPPSRTHSLSR